MRDPEHWGDAYYGAVYLESIADLLTPRLSGLEARIIRSLLRIGPSTRVLDAGCGHGRHAGVLAERVGCVVGVDRNAAALAEARLRAAPPSPLPSPPAPISSTEPSTRGERGRTPGSPSLAFVRGDVRALPLRDGAFDAAYSWYASLFMFDDATNLACLRELARVVRPGGRVLVHHANPLRLAREPLDAARRVLGDGTVVEEDSAFDARTGVDRSERRLRRPDGSVVAAVAELRYYSPAEWRHVSSAAGLRIVEITTTSRADEPPVELGPDAPDLIALLEKPT